MYIYLSAAFPAIKTAKQSLVIALAISMFLYLLLIIYQPFGTWEYQHPYKFAVLSPYAIFAFVSFYLSGLLSLRKVKWTIWAEMRKIFFVLLGISIMSYVYNCLYVSKVEMSWVNFCYMILYTASLVLPVYVVYMLSHYIYFEKKNSLHDESLAESIALPKSQHKRIEEDIENRITITYQSVSRPITMDIGDFILAEAADNYCRIYFVKNGLLQKEMLRMTLSDLQSQILSTDIIRVHRSYMINLQKVQSFKGNTAGYKILLSGVDMEVSVSRSYAKVVQPVLENR